MCSIVFINRHLFRVYIVSLKRTVIARQIFIMANSNRVSLKERYEAAMVLSGVGDALGYKNGSWEFCHSGELIHKEAKQLGGVDNIKINPKNWMVSDDTVMHIATAEGLVEFINFLESKGLKPEPQERMYMKIADKYKSCMNDMTGRAPGATCMGSCHMLKTSRRGGYIIPFNARGGGCGAAMRAMCIGLFYPKPEDIGNLIAVSVESGRMTHHHPTGYLGALAAALFTSYAIQGKPVKSWGAGLMETLPKALQYVKDSNIDVKDNVNAWDYFTKRWTEYLELRGISDGLQDPKFPEVFGVKERDDFYKSLSYSGWGGSSGHDAPMIAYDALLSYDGTWPDLCSRSMFHSGDSDSTGVIAACCYGAMFGFYGVNKNNYKKLEYGERLRGLGEKLYAISHPSDTEVVEKVKMEDRKTLERIDSLPRPPSDDSINEQGQSLLKRIRENDEDPDKVLEGKLHELTK